MIKLLLLVLLWLTPLVSPTPIAEANAVPVGEVHIHYYRYQADYSPWDLWVWKNQPTAEGGAGYAFANDDSPAPLNFGGVLSKIKLEGTLAGATRIGFIVRKPDWSAKDVDVDRFIDIPTSIDGGILHIYLVENDARIGYGINDMNGPDKNPKFRLAYFSEMNKVYFSATEPLTLSNIRLEADGQPINVLNYTANQTAGTLEINERLDFSKKYEIIGTFKDNSVSRFTLTYDGIYDSKEFEDAFGYSGDDLGAIATDNKTTFRVWAPISDNVVLNIYNTGTPANYGGSDVKAATHQMVRDVKGTFYFETNENLHSKYYTYSVTNGSNTHEVIDPYAKSSGINGVRGMVVDFSKTNPEGFVYGDRPNNMTNPTDAIIYELHVRDLTVHESWNGSEANRGRFLGLVEPGTSYQGVSTGFDHIKELGITHLQLIPFFDFGVLDETKINQPGYNSFNWGYMPLNFNVLEGAYSNNAYDGLVRINEMKTVVRELHKANIRLIMDVVYNHHGLTADSNFNLIVPGYYFRKNANGSFSNGSGTGNETASERVMMRKFIVDSTKFWTEEYSISGFRFDLMALHDIETMLEVERTLKAIDPTIMVFGEPWMGGTSPLPAEQQAGKRNLSEVGTVGAFNDEIRDAVKGSVFNREDKGFIQGNFTNQLITRIKYGILGGIEHPEVSSSALSINKIWHTSPVKTINYVTAHDNNTLHDKLHISLEAEGALNLIPRLVRQGNAIVLTSQGIAFLHAGDEFMRSKPAANGRGFDHNSYESPDSVNQLRWDYKARAEEMKIFEYFKGMIALRLKHPSFRMTDPQAIRENLTFVYPNVEGVIAFELTNNASNDSVGKFLVIHNANRKNIRVSLPTNGGWVLVADGDKVNLDGISTFNGGTRLSVAANSSYVLYQDPNLPDGGNNNLLIVLLSSLAGLGLAGVGIYFYLKKKKLAVVK
jgi:pullulanase